MPLEETITHNLIPALFGCKVTDTERALLVLPPRLGGLGICNPVIDTNLEYESSQIIASLLSEKINHNYGYDLSTIASQSAAKKQVRLKMKAHRKTSHEEVLCSLPDNMKCNIEAASEKGASAFEGEQYHSPQERLLRCHLPVRYNWQPPRLSSQCVCGKGFSVEHALSYHTGGLPSRRPNEVRDLSENLMSEVCPYVTTELHLQPLSGESFTQASTSCDDAA